VQGGELARDLGQQWTEIDRLELRMARPGETPRRHYR